MTPEFPSGTAYYTEERANAILVFKRNARNDWVEIQKFADFAEARKFIKEDAKGMWAFFDDKGERITVANTNPVP